jgi:hypothetical protein
MIRARMRACLSSVVFQKKLTVNEQAWIDNLWEQDAKDLEIKEARMKVDPNDLFKLADEYKGKCSEFNEESRAVCRRTTPEVWS